MWGSTYCHWHEMTMGCPKGFSEGTILRKIPFLFALLVALAALTLVACKDMPAPATAGTATTPITSPAGKAAPDLVIATFSNENYTVGQQISLASFAGKPVVLNFWYPSCPPCAQEMPHFKSTYQAYREQGVEFIGVQLVGLDSIADGQKFVDDLDLPYALGPDAKGEIVRAYKIVTFPTTVFLDKDHKIVRTWAGVLTEDKLHELVAQLVQ